jgi:hypothetical protein
MAPPSLDGATAFEEIMEDKEPRTNGLDAQEPLSTGTDSTQSDNDDEFQEGFGIQDPDLPKSVDPESDDFFDPKNLVTNQDQEELGIRDYATILIKRPNPSHFIQTHPDPAFWVVVNLLEYSEKEADFGGDLYLLSPTLVPLLRPHESRKYYLLPYITKVGANISLWPIKKPKGDRKPHAMVQTALQCAKLADSRWVQIVNTGDRYETFYSGDINRAVWPAGLTPRIILARAFTGRDIRTIDHPIIRKMRDLP